MAFADPCFAYRFAEPGEAAEDYGPRAARSIEQEIVGAGAETVMAVLAETVIGATAGAVPSVPGYFKRVREICDRRRSSDPRRSDGRIGRTGTSSRANRMRVPAS